VHLGAKLKKYAKRIIIIYSLTLNVIFEKIFLTKQPPSRMTRPLSRIVDTTRYPLDHPPGLFPVISAARASLESTGCASFPGFFAPAAIAEAVRETDAASSAAHVTDSTHNAFQLPGKVATHPPSHPRNLEMRTRVASMAYDEMSPSNPLRQLYCDARFVDFVRRVTSQKAMHRLADPIGACTVNIFKPGWYHAWHFDEAEFTTTLCLQQSEEGGEFEFTKPLRSDQSVDGCSDAVAAVIDARSEYRCEGLRDCDVPEITSAPFEPGTLQIFAGRYSLHHVKKIPERCARSRYVAVLCFSTEPGVSTPGDVQEMFWGRRSKM